MGKIQAAFLMPHPPIILKEVGKGEEKKIQKTIDSYNEASEEIKKLAPDTIIVMSPHGYVFRDAVSVDIKPHLKGDFGDFMAPEVKMEFDTDMDLAQNIVYRTADRKIPLVGVDERIQYRYGLDGRLNHGVMVPMYFVTQKYRDFKVVHTSYGFLPFEKLYEFGMAIGEAIKNSDKDVVFIASGDLSHKVTRNSPNGYTPKGKVFDELIMKLLDEFDVEKIIGMDKGLIEEAAECGFRSCCVMLGVLDGYKVKAKALSYEGIFGVGYGVAQFEVCGEREGFLEKLYENKKNRMDAIRSGEDAYISLARRSLTHFIKNKHILSLPDNLPDEMVKNKAGVFVSIHKDGELRGCIGTIYPVRDSIADEIIENAVSAGTHDPRFNPIEERELPDLEYSVDILTEPERIDSVEQLDVKKYGVIVRNGYRSGVLLPDLEGVDTPFEQVSIALKKAGIDENEKYDMYRFEVVRHK